MALKADNMSRKIPELFLWHVFHSIALALYALHAHENYDPDEPIDAGKGLTVHRDIKPENIFLQYKNNTIYPGYSGSYYRPVLGDFDLAVLIEDVEKMDTHDFRWGSNGYMAPVSVCTKSLYPCKESGG
jgi:serine/threonine protein kinase